MVSTKAQLLWLETKNRKQLGKIGAYSIPIGLSSRPKVEPVSQFRVNTTIAMHSFVPVSPNLASVSQITQIHNTIYDIIIIYDNAH